MNVETQPDYDVIIAGGDATAGSAEHILRTDIQGTGIRIVNRTIGIGGEGGELISDVRQCERPMTQEAQTIAADGRRLSDGSGAVDAQVT
mgnify:CR=1 FL=1